MKKKIIGILVVTLLIGTILIPVANSRLNEYNNMKLESLYNEVNNKLAMVYSRQYDTDSQTTINKPVKEITLDEADQIKKELILIEELYMSSEEKIREQIKIMNKWGLIPSEIDIQDFFKILEKFNNLKDSSLENSLLNPNVIVCGPTINSFLTLGGPQIPIHQILFTVFEPWWFNSTVWNFDVFGGTDLGGVASIMPALILWGSPMTIINIFGIKSGPNMIISPFMAILVLYAGLNIFISCWSDSYALNILDWSVGVSLTGLIVYI